MQKVSKKILSEKYSDPNPLFNEKPHQAVCCPEKCKRNILTICHSSKYTSLDDKMLVQNLQNDTVILCIPSQWHSHSTANNSHWPIITHHFFCFTNHLSANLLVSIFYLVCILASFKITSEITLCKTISDKKIFWETQGAN